MTRYLALFLLALCPPFVMAKPLVPGVYIYQENMGSLSLTQDASGQMRFEIQTKSANSHNCHVAGTVKGSMGIPDLPCKGVHHIPFTQINARDVRVGFNYDIHMCFCGANASFEGLFRIPPKACTKDAQHKRRTLARASYAKKDYQDAEKRLSSLLSECPTFMDALKHDAIRSDLALSQYHQGNHQACLKTLSQTIAWDLTCEEDLFLVGAGIRDAYEPIAKHIWFNRRLCEKALKKAP